MKRTLTQAVAPLLLLAVTSVGLTAALTTASTTTAHAAARVSVTNAQGTSEADSRYQTKLTIRGTGFQSVQGGFGGVYLMFGWVKDPGGGSWKPSRGGVTGEDYRYIPDAEDASNQGYLKFIGFPGGSTSAESHTVLSRSGSFSIDLTVPGPRFQAVDREGALQEVDCTKVTCGVITIGAHGVKNPVNETFTPVRFGEVYDAAPPTSPSTSSPGSAGSPGTESEDGAATPESTGSAGGSSSTPTDRVRTRRSGTTGVAVDRATATAGHALTFTGSGFTPGEQVVGVLDDGVAAIGPMLAGESGEIAGVLQLPVDLAGGTHELRLTGAASGIQVSERFAVSAAETATAPVAADDESGGIDGSRVFLAAAAVVFALALGAFAFRLLRRRRPRRRTAAGHEGVAGSPAEAAR